LLTWTNTGITGDKFNQGKHPDGATVYLIAINESGTEITDGIARTILAVNKPGISTASLPNATHNVAYSQAITSSGANTPLTFYLASSSTATAPCVNTWAVNASTGTVTGTPTVVGTDTIVITAIDSKGYNTAKMFTITVT
jgi:hypothetical protein